MTWSVGVELGHGGWASKARTLMHLMRRIRKVLHGRAPASEYSASDLVQEFNALSLPSSYLFIDANAWIHVVVIEKSRADSRAHKDLTVGQAHEADIIWSFVPETGLWTAIKDRTGGSIQSLCPIKCGGLQNRVTKK